MRTKKRQSKTIQTQRRKCDVALNDTNENQEKTKRYNIEGGREEAFAPMWHYSTSTIVDKNEEEIMIRCRCRGVSATSHRMMRWSLRTKRRQCNTIPNNAMTDENEEEAKLDTDTDVVTQIPHLLLLLHQYRHKTTLEEKKEAQQCKTIKE